MHPDLVQLSAAEIRLMHRPRTPPVSDGSALQSLAAGPEICAGFVAVITPGRAVRPPPPVSARVNFHTETSDLLRRNRSRPRQRYEVLIGSPLHSFQDGAPRTVRHPYDELSRMIQF